MRIPRFAETPCAVCTAVPLQAANEKPTRNMVPTVTSEGAMETDDDNSENELITENQVRATAHFDEMLGILAIIRWRVQIPIGALSVPLMLTRATAPTSYCGAG